MTPVEHWYLSCLAKLVAFLGRAPTIIELAGYCERTIGPTYVAMRSLEAKGRVRREVNGPRGGRRFLPMGAL